MKILLAAINAKYIHSNLAVYSLKAYAAMPGVELVLGEYTINQYEEEILRLIYEQHADVVAFSCYIWNIDYVRTIAQELKKLSPHMKIWLGGPEVSYDAGEVLGQDPFVDLVMIGEGEATFRELTALAVREEQFSLLDIKSEMGAIAGIAYRNGEEIRITSVREQMKMDDLPFVYEDLTEFENKIIYYETSRGCPFRCSYCLSSIDKRVRFRSFELVEQELRFFLDHQVKQVKFVDRTFNCSRRHAMEIWNYIYENDNGLTNFHFEIAADLLGEEELALMQKMRPGLIQLEIGVQSTYEPTITEIDRTMDLDRLSDIVLQINQFQNIHQHLDLIAGLPFEDYKRFIQSFNDIYALKPNQLQLGFLKVLKGSRMYQNQSAYGIVHWNQAPYEVLSTKWLSFEEVLRLKMVEDMVEVYYNSNQFTHALAYLMHQYEAPFVFFMELALYYKNKEYAGRKHNRMARYQILREFAGENPKVDSETLDNLLLYDLYLREDLKSRPAWALNAEDEKKKIYGFYQNDQLAAQYFEKPKHYATKNIGKMTHIEVFSIDLYAAASIGEVRKRKQYLLFDYEHRNPLTYEAQVRRIKELDDEDNKKESNEEGC